jgi:glycosyltransferase involved in cell wall biosynthesis
MHELPLTVSVGILARNEEAGIAQLIGDLGEQSLLTDGRVSVHVHVVANGCTDRTADAARRAFAAPPFVNLEAGSSVHELERAGKSNAWNTFVHEIVPESSDYVLFLDGDIRIPDRNSLNLVLQELALSPKAAVAVDRSVKDIELENPKGFVEKLIKAASGTANDPRTAIAGAFYCARYAEVRKIWMPTGLPGEDGFLRAMLLTSSFAHEERLERHVFVEEAYHVFESLRGVRDVVRHNVRLAIGTAVNILLFGHLRKVRAEGRNLADYIRERNAAEPDWVNSLVRERLRVSYFPLETRFVVRRLRRMRNGSASHSIRSWALALVGTGFDLVVFLRATALMRKGAGAGYW